MTTLGATAPSPTAATADIAARFHRDGFAAVGKVLTHDECAELRSGIDRVFTDDAFAGNRFSPGIAVRLFEVGRIFEEQVAREPIMSLVEHLLGDDCHLIAMNAMRSAARPALPWHIDDPVFYPAPAGRDRHSADAVLPPHALVVQLPLTDIGSDDDGPTQYIAGSHFSGRAPGDPAATPDLDGGPPVSMLARAGDMYLHNGQCWHQGAPNTSGRVRYLFQLAYGRRHIAQRFFPYVNYQLPTGVLERADERRRRVLGLHKPAAYG